MSAEARGRAREVLRTLGADYRHAEYATHEFLGRIDRTGRGRLPKANAAGLARDWFDATAGPSRVLALDHLRRNSDTGRCATDIRLSTQSFTVRSPGVAEFDEEGLEARGFRLEYGRRQLAVRDLYPCVLFGFHAVARFMMRGPRLVNCEALCSEAALLVRWYAPLVAVHELRAVPGARRPPNGKQVVTLPCACGGGAWIGRLATLRIDAGLLPVLSVRTFLDEGLLSSQQAETVAAVATSDHGCRGELEEAVAHCLSAEDFRPPQDAIAVAGSALGCAP